MTSSPIQNHVIDHSTDQPAVKNEDVKLLAATIPKEPEIRKIAEQDAVIERLERLNEDTELKESIEQADQVLDSVEVANSEDEVDDLVGEENKSPQERTDSLAAGAVEEADTTALPDLKRANVQYAVSPVAIVINVGDSSGAGLTPDQSVTHETGLAVPASISGSTSEPDGHSSEIEHVDPLHSPAISIPVIRPTTPASRDSTPPLPASAIAAKKFSSINVNKRFLSKTASPAPGPGTSGVKAASPIPITAPSKLLSTKLTTVPPSKSGVSPNNTSSAGGSAGSSPWAKKAIPPPSDPSQSTITSTLHQPAPIRGRALGSMSSMAMGTGHGIGGSARAAWRTLSSDESRSALGLAREFPTAKEVADGKKAAVVAAQAQAAHNEAILQELNVFSQLENTGHRWDDENDDDDVIDFGDGMIAHHTEPLEQDTVAGPIAKAERFVEDFDRSWPRKPGPSDLLKAATFSQEATDKVLFNASSNRLESNLVRVPQQPSQPPRLMPRPSEPVGPHIPPLPSVSRGFDRQLPPHLQNSGESGRMLPPHLPAAFTDRSDAPVPHTQVSKPQQSSSGPPRQAWNAQREPERPPLHLGDRPAGSNVPREQKEPHQLPFPPRRSFSQLAAPPGPPPPGVGPGSHLPHPPQPPPRPVLPAAPVPDPSFDQVAEMHTAAEKARLRRLAEEQEREAAAERARQKAKELEERLKANSTSNTVGSPTISNAVPPGIGKAPLTYTIAQRPKPAPETRRPTSTSPANVTISLPVKPNGDSARSTEVSWRTKMQPPAAIEASQSPPSHPTHNPLISLNRTSRPTAESFFNSKPEPAARLPDTITASRPAVPTTSVVATSTVPATEELALKEAIRRAGETPLTEKATPKRDFDDMLSRIKAAMEQARTTPAREQSVKLASNSDTTLDVHQSALADKTRPSGASASVGQAPRILEKPPARIEFFDVTQPQLPVLPSSAWRTYTVRNPPPQPAKPPIPRWRLQAFQAPLQRPPKGWLMSFDPPVLALDSFALSLSAYLLPPPPRHLGRPTEVVVSISPRRLEKFERKVKKKIIVPLKGVSRSDMGDAVSRSLADTLLPAAKVATTAASSVLKSQAVRPPNVDSKSAPARESTNVTPVPSAGLPVKASAAAKAEREGLFNEGVGIKDDKVRRASDSKAGVRFMVSSELEGDSLLDEVNKMSLESVGEGLEVNRPGPGNIKDDVIERRREIGEIIRPNLSHVSQPAPSTSTHASSSHPSISPGRSKSGPSQAQLQPGHQPTSAMQGQQQWMSQQRREHVKSVWDQAEKRKASDPNHPDSNNPVPKTTSQVQDLSTPLYPSLNAPSSADPPNAPLPNVGTSVKMGYSISASSNPTPNQHQTTSSSFQPTTTTFPTIRSQGYNYMSPPTPSVSSLAGVHTATTENAMGLYPGNRPASGVNGFTNQQGLWSGSTFASPANGAYAYGRPGTDQKAAMAFGKDYGYPNVSNIQNVQNGGQNSHATLAPAQGQGYPRGFPNYGYGYSSQATTQTQGGIGRFSVQTTPGHGENPSGTATGMVNGTSGIDYMYGSVDNTGGYYGGVQYQTQQTQGQGQYVTSPVRAQAGRGAPTRKMW